MKVTQKKNKIFFPYYAMPTFFANRDSFGSIFESGYFTTSHIIWFFGYIGVALLIVAIVAYRKKKLDESKPKLENPQFIRAIFENALNKEMKLEACFLQEGKEPEWKISAKIVSMGKKYAIIETNLSSVRSVEARTALVVFSKNDLKHTFAGRFSMRKGLRFILNQFETKCKYAGMKNDKIRLKMYLPERIFETQRREFPRVQIQPDAMRAYALWNVPQGRLISKPPTTKTAVYVSRGQTYPPYKIEDISATGLKMVLSTVAAHSKKLKLMTEDPCLLLLSLVKRSTGDLINIWLVVILKFDGTFRSPPMLGCEIKAWANHPKAGENFLWHELESGAEVPILTQWVSEELFLADRRRRNLRTDAEKI